MCRVDGQGTAEIDERGSRRTSPCLDMYCIIRKAAYEEMSYYANDEIKKQINRLNEPCVS